MHVSRPLLIAALAAAANAAPPSPNSGLPKLPGLPKTPGLPKKPSAPYPPKSPGSNEDKTPACTYNGTDDGKFDYSAVSLREVGARNTLDWRIWLLHKCKPISFWHDVCLSCVWGSHWLKWEFCSRRSFKCSHIRRSLCIHSRMTPRSSTPSSKSLAGRMVKSKSRAKSL